MADLGSQTAIAARSLPLAGAHGGSSTVRLELAAPAERLSLRARAGDVAALSAALGLNLPVKRRRPPLHLAAVVRRSGSGRMSGW